MTLGDPCPTGGCKGWIKSKSRQVEDQFLGVRGAQIGRIPTTDWAFVCSNGHKHEGRGET